MPENGCVSEEDKSPPSYGSLNAKALKSTEVKMPSAQARHPVKLTNRWFSYGLG